MPSLEIGSGDPLWTVYCWKRDAETLRGLRPVLAELVSLGDEPCSLAWEVAGETFTCLSPPPDGRTPEGAPCLACRLRRLKATTLRRLDQ
jgi:hypothetical protein